MMRYKLVPLPLYRTPRRPRVLTHKHIILAHIRDADENATRPDLRLRVRVERDPRYSHQVGAERIGGGLGVGADGGETVDVGPGEAAVDGAEETVARAGTEVEDFVL